MKDGWLRKTIKKVALVCYLFDLKLHRLLQKRKGEPRYELRGFCNGCGRCCESPMIQTNPLFFRLKVARWVLLRWHKWVNGFELLEECRQLHAFVFRCTHWDPQTKLCDSYESRPGMCRDYPNTLLYHSQPDFFQECSYYAVDKNAENFRKSLEKLDLPADKLEELEHKLYLKE